ncbi:MAG: ArdC family protein [Burkholderiales bacterium]
MLVTSKGKTTTTKELIEGSIGMLIEALEAGRSEVLTAYLSAMAKFHYYSFGNVLLIAIQKPGATRVAGIYAWNQLGRRVKRGEKGIMILAPLVGRRRKKGEEQNERGAERADAKSANGAKSNGQLIGFRPVYVWERLSRDLWPSLCAPDRSRGDTQSVLSIAANTSSLNSSAVRNAPSCRGSSDRHLLAINPGSKRERQLQSTNRPGSPRLESRPAVST